MFTWKQLMHLMLSCCLADISATEDFHMFFLMNELKKHILQNIC